MTKPIYQYDTDRAGYSLYRTRNGYRVTQWSRLINARTGAEYVVTRADAEARVPKIAEMRERDCIVLSHLMLADEMPRRVRRRGYVVR